MTYFFETYGCQMNKAESASIEQLLLARGWAASSYAETADLVIINTCSVRVTAETRIHGRLGWYTSLKKERALGTTADGATPSASTAESPEATATPAHTPRRARNRVSHPVPVPQKKLTVIVTGCMAQRLKDSLKKQFPVVDYCVGTFQKQHFEDIFDALKQNRAAAPLTEEAVYSFAPLSYEPGAFQAFVPIMHGCNNFCAYCIVPYVRGREVSRPVADILSELDMLSSHNVREVTLLGQNVNSYRWEERPDEAASANGFNEDSLAQTAAPLQQNPRNRAAQEPSFAHQPSTEQQKPVPLTDKDARTLHIEQSDNNGVASFKTKKETAGNNTALNPQIAPNPQPAADSPTQSPDESAAHIVDFPELLAIIAEHLRKTASSIGWVRFMSSHPKDASDRLIDVIAKERVLCRHIHLPVQNGSSAVLAAMNRKYTREQYIALVQKIRRRIPDVSLSTDLLVGFPGETDDDFAQTVSLMEQIRFDAAFMYYYNPREGTAAYSMQNQVPLETKKARVAQIVEKQLAITRENLAKRVGLTLDVLVEAVSHDNAAELLGRTERDERVVFAGDRSLIGSFARVKIDELTGNTFRGTVQS